MTFAQVLGWIGNVCFFSRFFVQWWHSERAGRSVAPPVFWKLSLLGSLTLGVYALEKDTHVLLVGYVLNGLIYARNLWFQRGAARPLSTAAATWIAAAVITALTAAGLSEMRHRADPSIAWVVVACVGQSLWSARFVAQWWASERAAHSHFPRVFWWLSLAGNSLLLAFAIHIRDPIFIAGFVPGPLVQIRNLMLGRGPAVAARESRGDVAG